MKRIDHQVHGRAATADRSLAEKPIPNYLKHTASSSHDTNCSYPKQHQQPSKASPMDSGKRLLSGKPPEGRHSPSASPSNCTTTQKPSNNISSRSTSTGSTPPSVKPVIQPKFSSDKAKTLASSKAFTIGKMTSPVKRSDVHGKVAKTKEGEMTNAKVLSAEKPQARSNSPEVKDDGKPAEQREDDQEEPMEQSEEDDKQIEQREEMNAARMEESERSEWDESREFTGERQKTAMLEEEDGDF